MKMVGRVRWLSHRMYSPGTQKEESGFTMEKVMGEMLAKDSRDTNALKVLYIKQTSFATEFNTDIWTKHICLHVGQAASSSVYQTRD